MVTIVDRDDDAVNADYAARRQLCFDLTPDEMKDVLQVAHARNQKDVKFGAMTYVDTMSGIDAHIVGCIAEKIVANFVGRDIDRRVFDSAGDDGIDTVCQQFGVAGVKATTYVSDPHLRVECEHFTDAADIYIAVAVSRGLALKDKDNPRGRGWLIGWAWGSEVKRAENVRRYTFMDKHGNRYLGHANFVLTESQLRPISELPVFTAQRRKEIAELLAKEDCVGNRTRETAAERS